MATKSRLNRRLYLLDEDKKPIFNGKKPVFAGKYLPARPKMIEEVTCPCHQIKMTIKVSDGQAVNLRKECKRQVERGDRDFKRQQLIGNDEKNI